MKKTLQAIGCLLSCTLLLGVACVVGGCSQPPSPQLTVYTVYAPDGAPALALSAAIADGENSSEKEFSFQYHVVDSSTIGSFVSGTTPQADFCILPLNLASKLIGDGESYRMLGTITNGNMYFLTTEGETLTENNLDSLIGKTVGVVQLTNVPGLTLQAVFSERKLPYTVLENTDRADEGKINLKAVDPQTGVSPAGGCDYYLCPEPAASAKVRGTQGKLKFAGDLQALYGENGYPQAIAVANVRCQTAGVEQFLAYMQNSAEYLRTVDVQSVVNALDACRTEGLTPQFTAANLTAEVIEHCSVRFTAATECKTLVNAFLAQLMQVNPQSATAVAEKFFYQG